MEQSTVQPDVNDVQLLRHELKVSEWYQDHPEYKSVKGIISKFGSDPTQVVQDPEFKKVYDALKPSDTQTKSVLTSNARIAMPEMDNRDEDLRAMREGRLPISEFLAKYKGIPMPTAQ